jgi:chitinase
MKEIEELGNGGEDSEGGNTSVDIRMEDTPSNYNLENQRYME